MHIHSIIYKNRNFFSQSVLRSHFLIFKVFFYIIIILKFKFVFLFGIRGPKDFHSVAIIAYHDTNYSNSIILNSLSSLYYGVFWDNGLNNHMAMCQCPSHSFAGSLDQTLLVSPWSSQVT